MSTGPTVLGFETSCDETGVAVVRGTELLSNVVGSQVDPVPVKAETVDLLMQKLRYAT